MIMFFPDHHHTMGATAPAECACACLRDVSTEAIIALVGTHQPEPLFPQINAATLSSLVYVRS